MRKNALLFLVLVGAGLICVAAFSRPDTQAARPIPVQSWQHMALTVDLATDDANRDANRDASRKIIQLGHDGWELVDVENVVKGGTTVKTVYYFKKPQ